MSDSQPFWGYSLRLYPKVADWCLARQDSCGVNVNLLLFGCFAGAQGQALSVGEWQALAAEIAVWDESVVKPLRATRQQMKTLSLAGDVESVRQAVMGAELSAEEQVQWVIYRWWTSRAGQPSEIEPKLAVQRNLAQYLALCHDPELPPEWVVEAALLKI